MGHELLWDWRVVLDLFLGGVGVGVFVLASLIYLLGRDEDRNLAKIGFVISPILVILGIVFLLLEIGRPFNSLAMMLNVNPTSILSWGGFLQAAFILVGLLIAFKSLKECQIGKVLLIVGMALAFFVGIYHGALLSALGRSAWNSALPVLFLSTSLASGFFLLLLIGKLKGYLRERSMMVNSSLIVFLLLAFVSVVGWLYGLEAQDSASKEALAYVFSNYLLYISIAFIFGIVAPLLYLLKNFFSDSKAGSSGLVLASIGALVGTFFLKFIVVYVGQLQYMV